MKNLDIEAVFIVLTIGHSSRTLEDFISILRKYHVQRVVDIRTVPRSRHNVQFNQEELAKSLETVGIGYVHMSGLGGFRRSQGVSINMGWRSLAFRGFADYMQTKEFNESLQALIELAKTERVVLMCAEAVPWRCHRSLIADALSVRDVQVKHIFSSTSLRDHRMTSFAKVEGRNITYPPSNQEKNANTLRSG